MPTRPIAYDEPLLTRDQTVMLIGATAATLDNWLRYGHVRPSGMKGSRLFSADDAVRAELIHLLAATFKLPPLIGRAIADMAIAEYRLFAEVDLADIWAGAAAATVPDGMAGRAMLSLVRDASGELRAWTAGDPPEHRLLLVLPTRLIARGVFAGIRDLIDGVTIRAGM